MTDALDRKAARDLNTNTQTRAWLDTALNELDAADKRGFEMSAELDVQRERIAALEEENLCDVCCGKGDPGNGMSCMCGGSGRMSDAARYLRVWVAKHGQQRDAALADLREAMRALEPFTAWLKGHYKAQPDSNPIQIGSNAYDLRGLLTLGDVRRAAALLTRLRAAHPELEKEVQGK